MDLEVDCAARAIVEKREMLSDLFDESINLREHEREKIKIPSIA